MVILRNFFLHLFQLLVIKAIYPNNTVNSYQISKMSQKSFKISGMMLSVERNFYINSSSVTEIFACIKTRRF